VTEIAFSEDFHYFWKAMKVNTLCQGKGLWVFVKVGNLLYLFSDSDLHCTSCSNNMVVRGKKRSCTHMHQSWCPQKYGMVRS